MSALTERITEVLRAHQRCFEPDNGPAFCGCNQWWHPDKTGGDDHAAHVAERIEAELVNYVADIQAAIVNAMNAVGVTLLGSTFELIESSPIPDDEIVALLAATWSEVES